MTLKITRPGAQPITGTEAVTQFISRVFPSAVSSIGKIRMLNEIGVSSPLFSFDFLKGTVRNAAIMKMLYKELRFDKIVNCFNFLLTAPRCSF